MPAQAKRTRPKPKTPATDNAAPAKAALSNAPPSNAPPSNVAPAKTAPSGAAAQPLTPAAPDGPDAADSSGPRPAGLRLAAAVQVLEAAGLCVAAVFGAVSTADGKSSQVGSGVALSLLAVVAAVAIAAIAAAVARARPWSRTPAVMTQLFVVIAGIALLDGHRLEWGVPALVLAAACVAGLFTPASLRALNRPPVTSAKTR